MENRNHPGNGFKFQLPKLLIGSKKTLNLFGYIIHEQIKQMKKMKILIR